MKICLIGIWNDFSIIDEGMKKISFFLFKKLSKKNEVLTLSIFNFFSFDFWRKIRYFNPDIIHYTCGGSLLSFILLKMISIVCSSKTVMTILQPHDYNPFSKFLITKLKIDIVLVQTQEQKELYKQLGFETGIFPSGVATHIFKPVNNETKVFLRNKYNIDQNKFIILHVGHIKRGRNLEIFKDLIDAQNEVIIVGSPSKKDMNEYSRLNTYGLRIVTDFFENIEEIYNLSDCYIFPVFKKSESISMPLSILEAMASNLPVISSKFGDLDRFFCEGDGLFFVNNENEMKDMILKIKNMKEVCTRKKVLSYSWEYLDIEMNKMYNNLLHGGIKNKEKNRMKKSFLICLVGIDGSGKTTQALALSKYLKGLGIDNEYVWCRWDPIILKPIIKVIQKILFYKEDIKRDYNNYNKRKNLFLNNRLVSILWKYSVLFDYFIKIFKDIKIPLSKKKIIICDRYLFDTIVDLAVDLKYTDKKIRKLINICLLLIPTPDIIFLIDLPEIVAFNRKGDIPSLKYLTDRRAIYLYLGTQFDMNVIKGDMSFREIQDELIKHTSSKIGVTR